MSTYLDTPDNEWFKFRLNRVVYFVLAAFVVLFARLFYLQILQGHSLREVSESNSIRLQTVDPSRGLIFDRNATLLVDNRPAFTLGIVLKDARPLEPTLGRLATHLNLPYGELKDKIRRAKGVASYQPILLRQDLDRDMVAVFEAHKYDLPGVRLDVRAKRHYLETLGSAHLLGYLGEINARELKQKQDAGYKSGDSIGKFGVEKTYETLLRGQRGGRQVEVNATGRIVGVRNTVDAVAGHSLHLTIDQRLQTEALRLLDGRAGALVAIDPTNGQVLALVSSPSFDQNIFVNGMSRKQWQTLVQNPLKPMANKAVQGEYPPASTYKIVSAMAGLEEKVIDERTTFYCPGQLKFGNRVYRCWKRSGHGKVGVVKALAESCDVFFYHVGQRLGVDRLAKYAQACGLGARTGFDLGTEGDGLVPTAAWKKRRVGRTWQKGETLSVAIGQGYNLVTPLQMAVLIAAVANDGQRLRPTILGQVTTATGQEVFSTSPVPAGQLPAGEHTMRLIRRGLFEVVNRRHGTAWGIRLAHLEICGKTGTAQVAGIKEDASGRIKKRKRHLWDHAWFVGYAPADNPRIAVATIVEHGEHGSTAAAPIVRDVIRLYLEEETSDAASELNQ